VQPFRGWTDLFIYPGYRFRVVDGLVTNFHMPRSSLLLLVSALVERERLLDAYREALARGYRFLSYGDGCLIV
jgi:S-adenosylmethionine:tRNA ribosyltransferase-isomerase